jgi:hypothetical protein
MKRVYLILDRRVSDFGDNQLEHVDIVLAWEERLSSEKLRQNAADCPHVDALVIVLLAEEELWCSVPST